MQLKAGFINFEITILNIYYENEEIIKKGVPQSAKISKLEWISSKFPSQLEFGGEHLFRGTAREVLFYSLFRFLSFFKCNNSLWNECVNKDKWTIKLDPTSFPCSIEWPLYKSHNDTGQLLFSISIYVYTQPFLQSFKMIKLKETKVEDIILMYN